MTCAGFQKCCDDFVLFPGAQRAKRRVRVRTTTARYSMTYETTRSDP